MSDLVADIRIGDCRDLLRAMPDESVNCVVTSPPYWGLRDYGVEGQLGLEATPEEYVAKMVEVFREARRVLRVDGTLWLNLGDTYCHRVTGNMQPKCLAAIPWRVAISMQEDGWILRSDIIWSKPNPFPESVCDRPTRAHEYLFLFAKSATYYYDANVIRETASINRPWSERSNHGTKAMSSRGDGNTTGSLGRPSEDGLRNRRSVWTVASEHYPGAHYAPFPRKLIEPAILAGCPEGGVVLDPFAGSGTVGEVAGRLRRGWILMELNPDYARLAEARTAPARPLPETERP